MLETQKKKAVFVDGASLSFMRRPMNIRLLNRDQLYQVLVKKIGKISELIAPPVETVSSNMDNLALFQKWSRTAGFNPVVKDSSKSKDDQFIIESIQGLDPDIVSEIVLVSSDRDYVPCLAEKAIRGVKIYWVAVDANGENGRPNISEQLRNIFRSEKFEFVELSQWADELRITPWTDRPRKKSVEESSPLSVTASVPCEISETPQTQKTIKISMEVVVDANRAPAILHSIGSLMGNVSKLGGIIRTKTTTEVK